MIVENVTNKVLSGWVIMKNCRGVMKQKNRIIFRASSFVDSDKFVRTATGSFVRMDSDIYDRTGSGTMPDFRPALKVYLIFFYLQECSKMT